MVRALVPQVYLRVLPGDLGNDGALLAGAEVDVKLRGDLVNSGTIAGRQLVSIDAGNIRNPSGGQISGAQVGLSARQDIDIIGSTVKATDALALKAGGNITVASTTTEWKDQGDRLSQQKTTLDRVAGLYVTNPSGDGVLSVVAGGDIGLKAAEIRNAGKDGITQLVAGGTLDLGAQTLGQSSALNHDNRNHTSNSQTTHAVSSIEGAGDVVLAAGRTSTWLQPASRPMAAWPCRPVGTSTARCWWTAAAVTSTPVASAARCRSARVMRPCAAASCLLTAESHSVQVAM